MKFYRIVRTKNNRKYIEEIKLATSVAYWQTVAKNDEKYGCYVEMNFEYNSVDKEVILSNYFINDFKNKSTTEITLIRNKDKLKKLNKK